MLFAVCQDGVEVSDPAGPVYRLRPPRDRQRVADDEVYLLFDEAPRTYRGHRLAYRTDLPGRLLPRPLAQAWATLPAHPRDVVRILIANGFGSGWGDVLVGSALLDLIHRVVRAAGKEAWIDFLLHPSSSDRQRHLEVYKSAAHLHRLHYTALTLEEYLGYDFATSTEGYLADPRFTQTDVYSFFLERLGLGGRDLVPRLRLYPHRGVLAEVAAAVGPWRAEPGQDPVLLVNFFATPPRAVPRRRWPELVEALAGTYRLAFVAEGDNRHHLAAFLQELPAPLRGRCRDLSGLCSRSFDHLVGVVEHGCDVVLTPDTSVLHVCGGLNKPCVGLFFSIEPEHRIRYYPTVGGYSHPSWRQSRFWGLSKTAEPGVQEGPEVAALWQGVDLAEVRALLAAVRRRAVPAADVVTEPVAATSSTGSRGGTESQRRRPRLLVLSGTAFPPGVERDDFTGLLPLALPADCEVDVAKLRPLEYRPLGDYDLVLFGLGDYLDEAVLAQPGLLPYLRSARRCLGVFGLRRHGSLPQETLQRLLGRLDCWFVPGRADLLRLGRATPRPFWLGEWRAWASPAGTWELDRELAADEAELRGRPWDEARRLVQRYRRVRCGSLGTLLAALGAAEEVTCAEWPDQRGRPGGLLAPLAAEILGLDAEPAPGQPLATDPAAYVAYRGHVEAGLQHLRQVIVELLQE